MRSMRQAVRNAIAATVVVAMLCVTAACGSAKQAEEVPATASGSVALFTPSEGVSIAASTPINRWTKLSSEINDALTSAGFEKDNIKRYTSDSFAQQSQDIQDYVVDLLAELKENNHPATLLIAPIAEQTNTERKYSEYTTHDITSNDTDVTRLVSVLKLAQGSGVHVVLMANSIHDFTPDAFVQFSDAATIGALQAQTIVSKLDLDNVKADDPKYIEVLLPYDGTADTTGDEAKFTHALFSGAWKVLEPYFQSGVAVSPSKKITSATKADDWQKLAYNPSKTDVSATLKSALVDTKGNYARIDGVLAFNDSQAADVVKSLSSLGYSGTSASTNPQISISGIVDTFTGKKDIDRTEVPKPTKKDDDKSSGSSDSSSKSSETSHWPVITGYGAYTSIMPNIVQGKQWMTGLENRKTIAADIADACVKLNAGSGLDDASYIKQTTVGGVDSVRTMSHDLLSVSATNLKSALIDPGYIKFADAGI